MHSFNEAGLFSFFSLTNEKSFASVLNVFQDFTFALAFIMF